MPKTDSAKFFPTLPLSLEFQEFRTIKLFLKKMSFKHFIKSQYKGKKIFSINSQIV